MKMWIYTQQKTFWSLKCVILWESKDFCWLALSLFSVVQTGALRWLQVRLHRSDQELPGWVRGGEEDQPRCCGGFYESVGGSSVGKHSNKINRFGFLMPLLWTIVCLDAFLCCWSGFMFQSWKRCWLPNVLIILYAKQVWGGRFKLWNSSSHMNAEHHNIQLLLHMFLTSKNTREEELSQTGCSEVVKISQQVSPGKLLCIHCIIRGCVIFPSAGRSGSSRVHVWAVLQRCLHSDWTRTAYRGPQ